MAHDVFISYASANKVQADAACARLEQARIRCWIAPRDIVAGRPYAEAIVEAIVEARLVVLVFSAAADRSEQVLREVERAVSKGIPIIPLRIEEVIPTKSMEYFLSAPHWLDALTPPFEQHLDRLTSNVNHLLHDTAIPEPSYPDVASPPPGSRHKRWLASLLIVVAIVVSLILLGWRMYPGINPPEKNLNGSMAQKNKRSEPKHESEDGSSQRNLPGVDGENEGSDPEPVVDDKDSDGGSDSGVVLSDKPNSDQATKPTSDAKEIKEVAPARSTQTVYVTTHDGAGAPLMDGPDFMEYNENIFEHHRLTNGTSVIITEEYREDLEYAKLDWVRISVVSGPDSGDSGWTLKRNLRVASGAAQVEINPPSKKPLPDTASKKPTPEISQESIDLALSNQVRSELDVISGTWTKNPSGTVRKLRDLLELVKLNEKASAKLRDQLFKKIESEINRHLITGIWKSSTKLRFELNQNPDGTVSGKYYRIGQAVQGSVKGVFQLEQLILRFQTGGGDGDMIWTFQTLNNGEVRWRSDGGQWKTYKVSRELSK